MWMWIINCVEVKKAQIPSRAKTNKQNHNGKIEMKKQNQVMNLYAQTCCCCDDDCLFISLVVSFWFLLSTDGTDWLLLFAFCWLFIVYNLIRLQISGSSNWSILSSSSSLILFAPPPLLFDNIYNSIGKIGGFFFASKMRRNCEGYSPVFSSAACKRNATCRIAVCLYVCANSIPHEKNWTPTQWSLSALFWLRLLNSCSIKTSLVTTCETLCIFLWPLSHLIPSNYSVLCGFLSFYSRSLCACVCCTHLFNWILWNILGQNHLIHCMENILKVR